jgi:hypothetical protein
LDQAEERRWSVKKWCTILASLAALILSGSATAQTCDIPDGYANQVLVVESDTLLVGFATDQEVYSPFDTVNFYLVVQNIGSNEFYINWNIDPQNGIFVLPTSCDSVYTPDCYVSAAAFFFPEAVYFMSAGTRLQPGECRVWQNSWDIATWGDGPPPDGTYNVFGGMFHPIYDIFPDEGFRVPRGGARLTIQIDSTIPVERGSWGQVKAMYK